MPAQVLMERLAAPVEKRTLPEITAAIEPLMTRYGATSWVLLRHPKPHQDPMSTVFTGRWPKNWAET